MSVEDAGKSCVDCVHTTESSRLRLELCRTGRAKTELQAVLAEKRFGVVLPRRKSERSPHVFVAQLPHPTVFRQDIRKPTPALNTHRVNIAHLCMCKHHLISCKKHQERWLLVSENTQIQAPSRAICVSNLRSHVFFNQQCLSLLLVWSCFMMIRNLSMFSI